MAGKEEALDVVEEVKALVKNGFSQSAAFKQLGKQHGVPWNTLKTQFRRARMANLPAAPRVCGADCLERVQELCDQGEYVVNAIHIAAHELGASESAVRLAWYAATPKSEWRAGSNIDRETAPRLLSALLALDGMGVDPSAKDVEELLESITGRSPQGPDYKTGRRFLKKCIKRGDFRQSHKHKMLTQGRADRAQILESASKFADQLQAHIDKTYHGSHPPAHTVVNVDETLLGVNDSGDVQRLRVSRSGTHRASKKGRKLKTIGSLIAFVAADGTCLLQIFVSRTKINDSVVNIPESFCVQRELARQLQTLRGSPELHYMFSESGRVNDELYAKAIDLFTEKWKARYPNGLQCLLFSDQLSSHRKVDMIKKALKNNVLCWSLPRNTSHITQPLDDVVFGLFKGCLGATLHEFLRQDLHTQFSDSNVNVAKLTLQAAYVAATKAFAPEPIRKSFKNTRLYPFIKDEWFAHVHEQVNRTITVEEDPLAGEAAAAVVAWLDGNSAATKAREEAHQSSPPSFKVLATDIHSPYSLVQTWDHHKDLLAAQEAVQQANQADRKRKAEERKAEKERAAAERVHKVCKYPGCKKKFRSGSTWLSCRFCDQWRLCGNHKSLRAGQAQYARHLRACVPPEGRRRAAAVSPELC